MQRISTLLCVFVFICCFQQGLTQPLEVQHLSTYSTGVFDEGAAEIVAHDPISQRLFFTNSDNGTIDVLDISDPNNPTLINQIDFSDYGDGVNSVAVSNGLLAAALENEVSTEAGTIAVFDTDGNFLKQFPAGVLPDMVTFSPDGTKIIVANEGEPDDDYVIDPEGSITIIDISGGLDSGMASQVDFSAYNDQKAALLNKGIRIFGPNATVAQDLEPEYITVSADNTTAFVGMQENNAVAVVNIAAATVVDLLPLGYKDHDKGELVLQEYRYDQIPWWPTLGTPAYEGAETVDLGGFSGMWYDALTSNSKQSSFFVIPDRGPNESTVSRDLVGTSQNLRPFKLPNYQARIEKLILLNDSDQIFIDANPIFLTRKDGVTPISGRGNIPGFDEVPVTRTDASVYTNTDYEANGTSYHALEYDPYGGDFEGILRDGNQNWWMCDEYRPAIYNFSADGVLIERYVPKGTSLLGDSPQPEGFYGAETLPAVYSKRRANRGFEAIALDTDENIVYAFIQTPLYNPNSGTRNNSDVIRILGINPEDGSPVKEFVYLLERNRVPGIGLSRTDKIGDAVYIGNGKFLVLERDSSGPDDGNTGRKYIFEIDTKGATNIINLPISAKDESTGDDDKTLEMMTADDLAAAGIHPVFKTKVTNLPSIGYLPSDKPEGLAVLPNGDIAVMNDNDFGLAGAGVSDASSLGILRYQHNHGFDASNESDAIEIVPRPTLGMYQPDAISSFTVNGKTYLATANEGDARDYDGYSEEDRVKDLELDPTVYPAAADLQEEDNLGRLLTTLANGDRDGDGDVDQIYSYGARSFSIWDENGNLVFDSGDDFEQITADVIPDYFNSQGDDRLKNRSDDKGPEPEAIAVGEINGELYAVIGLERVGGFMVYKVSDPYNAEYVTYFYNRDFSLEPEDDISGDIAPEDVIIIQPEDSPTGSTLIVSSAEVSGTISLFEVSTGIAPLIEEELTFRTDAQSESVASLSLFPNPVQDQFNVRFNLATESQVLITVLDQNGQTIMVRHYNRMDIGQQHLQFNSNNWPAGMYYVNIKGNDLNETAKLIKVK